MRLFGLGVFVFLSQMVFALPGKPVSMPEYYGKDFFQSYESGKLRNQQLLDTLQKIISKNQNVLSYDQARRHLFGKLFLEELSGSWAVKEVYCERTFTNKELSIGPGQIPNGNVLNTEHTWPQSRFTHRFPKDMQKSDLHHLFPTDYEMNSHRGSLRFGNVKSPTEKLKCPISQLGHGPSGEIVFEAPQEHKGNVARAIFYFATRYQMKISRSEEEALREWNQIDPVDEEETSQNDMIHNVQGNRNPFIDFPDLLTKVNQFSSDYSQN